MTEQTPFVDVHCHCFNASDLPIAGFAEAAILRESAAHSLSSWKLFWAQAGLAAIGPRLRILLEFVDALAKAACVSAAAELAGMPNHYVGHLDQPVDGDIKRLTLLLSWLRQAGTPEAVPAGVVPPSRALLDWALTVVQQSGGLERLFSIFSSVHESHQEAFDATTTKRGNTDSVMKDELLAFALMPNAPGNAADKEAIRKRAGELASMAYAPGFEADWAAYYMRLGATGLHARGDLVGDLDGIYQRQHEAGTKGRLRIYTPAMIDYDFWVQRVGEAKANCDYDYAVPVQPATCAAVSTTPLSEQIDVWEKVSADKAKARDSDVVAHGFVAFDPLRYIIESAFAVDDGYALPSTPPAGSALDLVMTAVMRKGCVGVKLYPPMGFLPAGNDDQGLLTSAAYLRGYGHEWGDVANRAFADIGLAVDDGLHQDDIWARQQKAALLDQALDALYRLCSANHVPIMTHASRTQGTFYANSRWRAAALGANPTAWLPVLAKYPNLRLNFGHAGGIWCLGALTPKDAQDHFADGETHLEPVCELATKTELDGGELPVQFGVATWPLWLLQMMSLKSSDGASPRYPHIYADVSDWDELSETQNGAPDGDLLPHAERAAKTLGLILGPSNLNPKFDPALISARLMFGSDWIVMGKSLAAPRYLDALMHGLEKGGVWNTPLTRAAFLGGNALNFLGLTKNAHDEIMRDAGTSEAATPFGRLKAFYAGLGPEASLKWLRLKAALGHA